LYYQQLSEAPDLKIDKFSERTVVARQSANYRVFFLALKTK
jgi:hypothetical protein